MVNAMAWHTATGSDMMAFLPYTPEKHPGKEQFEIAAFEILGGDNNIVIITESM